MNREGMLKPALIGGVLLGVLSALPAISAVNCLCCAWVIAGGVLAANLYVKSSPLPVALGTGALVGLLAGVIGAVVDTIFSIPLHILLTGMGFGVGQLRQAVQELPMAPEARETVLNLLRGGGGVGVAFVILSGIFKLFIYSIMATLGGTLGVALFEKRKPDIMPPGVPPAYQPPPPPQDFPPPPPPPPPTDIS
jgi:hypothetical protein